MNLRKRALAEHRAALLRAREQSARVAEAVHAQGTAALGKALSRSFGTSTTAPLAASTLHQIEQMARRGVTNTYVGVASKLAGRAEQELQEAARALGQLMESLHGYHAKLDLDAERVKQVQALRRRAVARTGALESADVTKRLSQLLVGKHRVMDAIAEAVTAHGEGSWRAARTAVTETSWAWNAEQEEGIEQLASEVPGLMKRWTERVDDATRQPMDNRVGIDSMVLHGQVTAPGGRFVMPNDPRAPAKMIGKSWAHPPNRPHDRAVCAPWHPRWGVPGYIVRGGQVVDARTGKFLRKWSA